MGCGESTGSGEKIKLKKTNLGELDEVFDDVQNFIDEVYDLMDPIEEARDKLLNSTKFDKVRCGNTHHAIVGIVFAMYASSKSDEDAMKAFHVTTIAPFLEINKKSASGKLVQCIDDFTAYVTALRKVDEWIPLLAKKANEIAEKASDLPDKAKADAGSAEDLSAMDKLKAWK